MGNGRVLQACRLTWTQCGLTCRGLKGNASSHHFSVLPAQSLPRPALTVVVHMRLPFIITETNRERAHQ
jgi:hypothetical protein